METFVREEPDDEETNRMKWGAVTSSDYPPFKKGTGQALQARPPRLILSSDFFD